jgi:hypothetical protein
LTLHAAHGRNVGATRLNVVDDQTIAARVKIADPEHALGAFSIELRVNSIFVSATMQAPDVQSRHLMVGI